MMKRKLRRKERILLQKLIDLSDFTYSTEDLTVSEMNDGGMGSIFFHSKQPHATRRFSSRIAEEQFMDSDNTPIMVSLNIDQFGELYELDIWKVDYSKVIKFPE